MSKKFAMIPIYRGSGSPSTTFSEVERDLTDYHHRDVRYLVFTGLLTLT